MLPAGVKDDSHADQDKMSRTFPKEKQCIGFVSDQTSRCYSRPLFIVQMSPVLQSRPPNCHAYPRVELPSPLSLPGYRKSGRQLKCFVRICGGENYRYPPFVATEVHAAPILFKTLISMTESAPSLRLPSLQRGPALPRPYPAQKAMASFADQIGGLVRVSRSIAHLNALQGRVAGHLGKHVGRLWCSDCGRDLG